MIKKLSFRSVVSLVIGSQIGSGVFLLPASLAIVGPIGLFGWLVSGTGAIFLALVFAKLSMIVSNKGGGPHVYVERAFGKQVAFFVAWTYWLVSWLSSVAVIIAAIGYFSLLVPLPSPNYFLMAEMIVVIAVTLLNMRGIHTAGSFEIFFTVIKCLPLIIVPIAGLIILNMDNLTPMNPNGLPVFGALNSASLMTFWGFLGIEMATTTSSVVDNPSKTIPRAILLGTSFVIAVYLLSSISIMGVIPQALLAKTQAPYAVATQMIFGAGWDLVIAAFAFIACLGTLNAWVLASGQIALQASKDGLFPPIFSKVNRHGSPTASLTIVLICTLGLLVTTLTPDILKQMNVIIDLSVLVFLMVYLLSAAALIKILLQEGKQQSRIYFFICAMGGLFCIWVLAFASIMQLFLCSLFVVSGIPVYLYQKKYTLAESQE